MYVQNMFTTFVSHLFYLSVSYPPYGTFTKHAPFDAPNILLPKHPTDIDTKFIVHTRTNSTIVKPLAALPHLLDNRTQFITVIIHGFLENGNMPWIGEMKRELLNKEDMLVISVDYYKGAGIPYHQAVGNARLVGRQISHFIRRITVNVDRPVLHFIGFSLGAHVAAYASEDLARRDFTVDRITGLDPASPLFENEDIARRLDPNSAAFVDVIHTDTEKVLGVSLGAQQEMGNVDFYPNGGLNQPGCQKQLYEKLPNIVGEYSCSHYASVHFFIESIRRGNAFKAIKCESYDRFIRGDCKDCAKRGCNYMGYDVRTLKGRFYLKINNESIVG